MNRIELKENYENLANAIIIQAASEYKLGKKKIKKNHKKIVNEEDLTKNEIDKLYDQIKSTESNLKKIAQFFKSEYYCLLSNVDGDYMIRRLEESV